MVAPADYYNRAKENEVIFRDVLRDLRDNRTQRSGGIFVPPDLDSEGSLSEIVRRYSKGDRYGKFTILNFDVAKNKVRIAFENVVAMGGGGADLEYILRPDGSVAYNKSVRSYKSFI